MNNEGRRIEVDGRSGDHSSVPRETLVVASKLKAFVKAKYDMNTSANVIDRLSDRIRSIMDEACIRAKADGRKTVKDRDIV